MRIIIIGSGYVGLVSAACLADLGHEVLCVDNDTAKVARLQAGDIPIFEPDLAEMIARNVARGRMQFADALPAFGSEVAAVFLAVGTPPLPNGGANLDAIFAAAEAVAAKARQGLVVVIKSTVPVGTGDAVERLIHRERPDLPAVVVSNPEFLREGSAISDFMEPDRIVVGTDHAAARRTLMDLYAPLIKLGTPVVHMRRRAAELTKYAANAFLAIKIAFANEMADLCEAIDADIDQVMRGVGLDSRIGPAFLQAGPGYGGSCFPKDSSALLATAQDHAVALRLVESAIAANDARKRALGERVRSAMGDRAEGRTVAILGLTFKPDTDDVRDAPAFALIESLQRAGSTIRVFDPKGMNSARRQLKGVTFSENAYECAEGAHCLVLATHWSEFATLDATRLSDLVATRLLVDLRNGLDAAKFSAAGFVVHGIGRSRRVPPTPPVSLKLRSRPYRPILSLRPSLNGHVNKSWPPAGEPAPR